jgi:pimeloyl-ACP methyl ester carboxylesterase
VAFVIAVSGPGVSPGEQMILYYANELRRQGLPEGDVQEASAVRREVWSYMSSGNGYERVNEELEQARTKRWFNDAKAQQDDSFGTLPKPEDLGKPVGRSLLWFRQEMNYDPVVALRALRVPALFLFGDRDQLIPVQESVAVLQRVSREDVHHDFTIRELADDDHEMRVDVGEKSGEIDPDYLRTMRAWLATHVLKGQ